MSCLINDFKEPVSTIFFSNSNIIVFIKFLNEFLYSVAHCFDKPMLLYLKKEQLLMLLLYMLLFLSYKNMNLILTLFLMLVIQYLLWGVTETRTRLYFWWNNLRGLTKLSLLEKMNSTAVLHCRNCTLKRQALQKASLGKIFLQSCLTSNSPTRMLYSCIFHTGDFFLEWEKTVWKKVVCDIKNHNFENNIIF